MKQLSLSILFLLFFVTTFTACDDDNIFHPKVKTSGGITTVSSIRPGGLEKALFLGLSAVSHLVIEDTIDSRDFKTMRDLMPNLSKIDLSKATIAAYNGYEGTAGTRNYYYTANAIPEFAFYNPETSSGKFKLQSIKLPTTIKSIRDFAFSNCGGLNGTIEIPASVRDTIGRSAFAFCEGISQINLSAVRFIGESAFQNCSNLAGTLTIPDSVFIIKPWAFANCSYINSVEISKTISQIASSAFNGCGGLFNVDPANISFSAQDGVLFSADKSILIHYPINKTGTYNVPSTVGSIGEYSFANCTALTALTLPTTTNSIENYAFNGCSNLNGTFTIPLGMTSIGQNVFNGCSGLSGFSIAPGNSTYSVSNGVLVDLGQLTLKRCLNSKTGSYVIPSDIMFIDNSAFSDCAQLTSVTIPESILSIGHRAFYNCKGLRSIYVQASAPIDLTYTASAFEGIVLEQCTLYVPKGTKANYEVAVGWKNFYNMIEN